MKQKTTKIYHWALQKAASDKAPLWLALLFGLELILFIPLDAVLMFFCLQRKENIFLYVILGTVASTISGCIGYLLGHFLWHLIGDWVVPQLLSTSLFDKLTAHFHLYESWAVFIGGLIPFPLKAISLVAGVFKLGLGSFAAFLAAARLCRFSLIGIAMTFWGPQVKTFLDRHFHRVFMLIGAKVAVAAIFFYVFAR